ncbi:RHS repeat domain-containing protein [Rapidithrix thailandica]|uniref:RHS repeat domain-containing protein n=1 Tax=Rapidithrix thailandica TaxID=413964 RepID=UPI0032175805
MEYNIYGNIRSQTKGEQHFIPFRNQGQYEDAELDGLMYNRFRYYDGNSGMYISQDPIGLAGNNPNIYGYVSGSNMRIDPLGLMDPWDIQFTQNSISDKFNEGPWRGKTSKEAIEQTAKEGKLPNGLQLNVMELNGGQNIVTLNNRTLYVAQEAGLNYVKTNFVDNINKLNKLLDGGMPLDLDEQPIIKCKK